MKFRNLLPMVLMALATATTPAGKAKAELFTSYFGVQTPTSKAQVPTKACLALIRQAHGIVGRANGLKTLSAPDLLTASLNLRACATSAELPRADRDFAVGLYGEMLSERERRDRQKK